MSISVICPSYRNPKCLDIFLKSATENRTLSDTEIIVILDGYGEESEDVMAKYPDVLCLRLAENKGMQYAINIGVMQASHEAIFIVNDDNVLGRDYDKVLVEEYDPNVVITANQIERTPGIFGFVVRDFGDPDNFDYQGFLDEEEIVSHKKQTPDGNIFPFLMNKRWFMVVGGFDTFYDSPNVCDLDFFLKLELCGFSFVRSHHLHLYHFGSVATKKNAEKNTFTDRERKAYDTFFFKWGFMPSYGMNNSKLPPTDMVRGVRFR